MKLDSFFLASTNSKEMAISVVELTELYGYMAAGSHQSLWESQEDGRRYHKRFFQKLKNGCHDLAVRIIVFIINNWNCAFSTLVLD